MQQFGDPIFYDGNTSIWLSIGKELDPTNSEDSLEYIWPFTYLFNKKKFEKLLEWWEWDYEINLMENVPKKLNAKAYVMMIKKEESLNQ